MQRLTFAGQAAHDLQEPLRLLGGYLDLLKAHHEGKLALDEPKILEEATATVERMQRMVGSLLDLTRLSSAPGRIEAVPLARALAEAEAVLRLRIEESGATVTKGDLPTTLADPSDLARLFQNLLENSLKYHGPGAPRIHVSSERAPGGWWIRVDDDGQGWPRAGRERLFEPFTRLHDASVGGFGLGLASVRAIVDRYHGSVRALDAPSGGARVEIFLPGGP